MANKRHRKPTFAQSLTPREERKPRVAPGSDRDQGPVWLAGLMDFAGPWSWRTMDLVTVERVRERLAALERVMRSLDPDSVLQRGYARVTNARGRTLTTAAEAGKEPALTLRFRDGSLEAVPGGAARKRPTSPKAGGEQPKLL